MIESYDDTEKWISSIKIIVKKYNIDLTIAGDERSLEFLIRHKESLQRFAQVPLLPSLEYFDIARDKSRLAELIKENNLSQPKTFIYKNDKDLSPLSNLKYPVLIKNPTGEGGKGIERFNDEESLKVYFQAHDFEENILCQEYISGHDICISVLCKDGVITAYTIQQCLIENPKLYAPSLSVEFVQNEKVLNEASLLMNLLNWQGVAHIDMRLDPLTGQVYVIEINPRFWDSLFASLIAGVNFTWLYCQQMLNLPIKYNGYKSVQVIRVRTLLKCLLGRYQPQVPCRFFSLRTGFSFHFYKIRRILSLIT
jgi:predicted ATP-grasp superfamily ATP-dependent carboligase